MFNIKLVDIAGDGLVTQYDTMIETLALVEKRVTALLNGQLGVTGVELVHDDELVYSVWLNGREIGVVVIKDVNPVSIKRK